MRSGARGLVASRWHGCCHGVLPHAPSLAWLLAHLAKRRLARQRRAVAARARRRRRCAACAQRCRAVRRAEQGRGARGGRGRHRVRFWDRGGGAAPRHSRTLWYSIRNDVALLEVISITCYRPTTAPAISEALDAWRLRPPLLATPRPRHIRLRQERGCAQRFQGGHGGPWAQQSAHLRPVTCMCA